MMYRSIITKIMLILALYSSAHEEFMIDLYFDAWPESEVQVIGFRGTLLIPFATLTTDENGRMIVGADELAFTPGFVRFQVAPENHIDLIVSGEEHVTVRFKDSILTVDVTVEQSEENLRMLDLREINKHFGELIHEVNLQQSYMDPASAYFAILETRRDSLIALKNDSILKICTAGPELYFSKVTAGMIPPSSFRWDAQTVREKYFQHIDFQDPAILNSTLLPNQYMRYFESQVQYDEDGFKYAVDQILGHASANEEVFNYSLEYLMELFGTVGPEIIFEYLVEEYYVRNACLDQVADAGVNQKIKDYLNVQPGMLIPDTEFYSDHDLEIPVRELMSLNELTIIFYWSSYCHFCEGTLPELEALYQSYKDRGLHVVTVALDTGADEWREASGKLNGTWDHICDFKGWESANARTFMVNKTPTMFLVNKEGMLLGKSTNISAIRALVDAIL